MIRILQTSLIALASILIGNLAQAGSEGPPPFSAEAVQRAPQQGEQTARMYVGGNAVRTEYSRGGQQYAEIVFKETGRRVLLMPQQRAYMEHVPDQPPPSPVAESDAELNPCAGATDAECKRLGTETVNGRETVKWEIVSKNEQGQRVRSLHWIDTERRMPIREYLPDGTVRELKPLGTETVNGRQTEKWETVTTRPDGNTTRTTQWYDPELKIAIREQMPGGYVRELRNIEVGSQPDELFRIPQGYRKVESQQRQQQRPQQPQPRQAPPRGYQQPGYR